MLNVNFFKKITACRTMPYYSQAVVSIIIKRLFYIFIHQLTEQQAYQQLDYSLPDGLKT